MSGGRILTGGHTILYINGKVFGRCFGFTFDASTASREIGGIDSTDLYELAPSQSRISMNMDWYRTIGDGGAEGAAIAATPYELPRGKYFSVMLVDRSSDTVVFQADNCRVEGQNWRIMPKQFVVGSIRCKALSWNNEVKPYGI